MAKGGNTRDVNLRIKAEDATGAGVRSAEASLNKIALAQGRIGRENYSAAVASARTLGGTFQSTAARAEELEKKARAAGLSASGPLVAQFRQSQRAAQEAGRAYGQAAQKLVVMQAQQRGQRAGLAPHQVQNLGYQINDLFTQVASGTSVMQALAQQGGQIAQIFPGASGALLRFAGPAALAAAAAAPFIAGWSKARGTADAVKDFSVQLAATADKAAYDADKLASTADRLDSVRGSAGDARAALSEFIRNGVDPAHLERFGLSAQNLARVTGKDIPDAAKMAAEAFTGTFAEVDALDQSLNFLTSAEREQIRAMFDSGDAAAARTEAFRIFDERMQAGADLMDGPWSDAARNFANAWDNLVGAIANSAPIQAAIGWIGALAKQIAQLTAMLPGARGGNTFESVNAEIIRVEQRRMRRIAAAAEAPSPSIRFARDNEIAADERILADLRQRQGALRPAALPADVLGAGARRDKAEVDRRRQQAAPRTSGGSAARDTRAEETARFLDSLTAANAQREFELSLIGKAEREARILTEIERARLQAAEAHTLLSADQEKAIRDSVGALYDARAEQEAAKTLEQARLDLARERGEVESRAAFIARVTAEGMANATAETKAAYAQIMGAAYDIAEAARRRQAAERDTNALVQQRSILLQRLGEASEAGDTTGAIILRDQIVALNAQIVAAATNTLALLQSLSGPEAEAARMGLEELISGAGRLNGEMERVGQTTVLTAADIDQMLVGGGVNALGDFTDALGEGAGVFDAMRDSFLNFAAYFLTQIAQMIAQQAILNALGAGAGTSNGSRTGGFLSSMINGLFRHDGGLVGSGGGWRPVNPAVFAGAMRYHSGGLAGLRPDEVPAILQRNEEVLTEDDPRHRNNGGLAGRAPITLKSVNVIDPGDMVAQGLETESGERSFFNFIGRNAGAIKAQMG